MRRYEIMDDYGTSFQADKNHSVKCYSKQKMKELFPDGNFKVVGETCRNNKKDQIDEIELANRTFVISKEEEHSSVFFRTAGYINTGNGEYVALLKRNFLFLWLFLGAAVLAGGIILGVSGKKETALDGVLAPDFEAVQDDANAVREASSVEWPEDTVTVRLPKGTVDFKADTQLPAGETVHVAVFMETDGELRQFIDDEILISEDGNLGSTMINFPEMKFELKPGKYLGKIVFTTGTGENFEHEATVNVFNTLGGQVTVEYMKDVTVNLTTGEISMSYKHGDDATHDAVLQLILDNGGKEYLLSQSGSLHAGSKLTQMELLEEMKGKLAEGVYHGRLRAALYNGENELTNTNADIEVTIKVVK